MNPASVWSQYVKELSDDPLVVLTITASLIAMAVTPIAFAVLGKIAWFKARRGRVLQQPSFASIIAGMMLVMGIPAIVAVMAIKSRHYDRNLYQFDPNINWSVLDQGRGFKSLQEADQAVKQEMERLATERKNLVNGVKKLDETMLALRAVAGTSAPVAQAFPEVLQALAGIRRSVGVDGPQQLLDYTAPPVELSGTPAGLPQPTAAFSMPAGMAAPATAAATPAHATAPAGTGFGLQPAQVETEIAAVPEPQKGIAAMLPLTNLPAGWTVGKSGDRYIETFNAENLYEKIDGRAESFTQYSVQGMAYTYYQPMGDDSNELQVYIFEMASPLKALGKYGSEKPEDAALIPVGDEGYTAAGSTLFYAGKYYTQIVSTQDDPKFAEFALDLAKRIANAQKPGSAPPASAATTSKTAEPAPVEPEATAAAEPATPAAAEFSPATYFAFLPPAGKQGDNKYVAQDVFGYSFLSDVFMADYKEGDVTWQGFLRPYKDESEAKEMLQTYIKSVKQDEAEVTNIQAEGADEMIVSSSIGLFDVILRKGNTLAGANGATAQGPAEAFAKALAKSLPAHLPSADGP